MERAYMPPAEPPPLEHDTWGAPHPKGAVAGARPGTAGFDPSRPLSLGRRTGLCAPFLPWPTPSCCLWRAALGHSVQLIAQSCANAYKLVETNNKGLNRAKGRCRDGRSS